MKTASSQESVNSASNENTTNTPEPIEVSGGDSIVSFDDIERAKQVDTPPEAKTKRTKDKDKEESEVSESKDKKTKGGKDGKESDEEKSEEEEVKEKETDDKVEKPVKTVKIKNGDSDLELRSDGLVTVNVNGKPEQTTVQELLDNYSGKTNWGRRFQKLGEQEAALKSAQKDFESLTLRLHQEGVKNKDPISTMNILGEVMGWDMDQFWQQTTSYVSKRIEELSNLTPEERRAFEAEERLKKYEQRDKQQAETKKYESAMSDLEKRVETVMESLGLNMQEFEAAYRKAVNDGVDPNISPEDFGKYYKESETKYALVDLVTEVANGYSEDEVYDAVSDLWSVVEKNPDLSEEDIREIAVEVYGNKAAKNLTRKLQKAKPLDTAKVSPERRADPISFDDLG